MPCRRFDYYEFVLRTRDFGEVPVLRCSRTAAVGRVRATVSGLLPAQSREEVVEAGLA